MPRAIVMPSMGMYTEEGVLTAWLRPAGQSVAAGEPVAEITTEKATFEIPAPDAGILHPMAAVGTQLRIEALMGYILAEGEAAPSSMALQSAAAPAKQEYASASSASQEEPTIAGPLRATPVAKRLAAQHGIDLRNVKGSGPGGRIVEADVNAFVSKPGSAAHEAVSAKPRIRQTIPLAGMRRTVAVRLSHTLATAASTTLTREVAADILAATRQRLADKLGSAPSYDALFIKFFAAALREHPALNSTIENDAIVQFDEVHIGFAVAVSCGLIVPVVHDADSLPLAELTKAVQELRDRATTGRLRPADLEGGTATISNLGGSGIDAFTPILNGSQSAILGIGRIAQRPVVRDAVLAIGHTTVLSLTFDHRVADGVPAAQLLDAVARRMNDENFLASLAEN